MEHKIVVFVKFRLKFPYDTSLIWLQSLCLQWRLDVISANTKKPISIIKYDWKTFKRMFGINPRQGNVCVLEGLLEFIEDIIVTKVFVESCQNKIEKEN